MLRLLVEKSELWVFKKKGNGKKEKITNEEDESAAPAAQPVLVVCFTLLILVALCAVTVPTLEFRYLHI